MKIIKNENTVFFDVDQTLIMHPASCDDTDSKMIIEADTGENIWYTPHEQHIGYIKKSRARGRFVVVWSANGHKWAEQVVKELKLQKYVDLIMTKPTVYFDDVPADKFMSRVYIELKKD